jgi:hypothetical protein
VSTNLSIDDQLIERARRIGRHRTQKAVVTEALEEYIQRRKQFQILDFFHEVKFDSDYDYKEQRNKP